MSTQKKEQKIQEKNDQKLTNLNEQIENIQKNQSESDKEEGIIVMQNEIKDIIEHCILKADTNDDVLITLDGWNKGHNNIIIWDLNEFIERQRINFSKNKKICDLCFMQGNKNVFLVGGEDKILRLFVNKQQNEITKFVYEEVFSIKIKNKINCIKYLQDNSLLIGTKNGPLHYLNLINLKAFTDKFRLSVDESNIEKVDIEVQQKQTDLHERKINDIFIFQNKYALTLGEDKVFIQYNIEEEKILAKHVQQSCIRCGYLDEQKSMFYTGNTAGQVIIYNLDTFEEVKKIEANNYIYSLLQLDILGVEHFLCSTNKKSWFLFDLAQNKIVQQIKTYNDYISSFLLLSNGNIFLGEGKNLFQIWKIVQTL